LAPYDSPPPDRAPRVARRVPRGRRRRAGLYAQLEISAYVGVLTGNRKVIEDRATVETGAADVEDRAAERPHVARRVARRGLKLRDRELVTRVNQVEQVVVDFEPMDGRGLRRANVHTSVDRHRVDAKYRHVTTGHGDRVG
jgi:hypothetical protein